MKNGFLKVACAVPKIKIGDCRYNSDNIITLIKEAAEKDVSLVVFPELSITAYTCGDLFLQLGLLKNAIKSLTHIAEKTKSLDVLSIVGLPYNDGACVYNTAAVLYHGEILGIVPKTNLPNYLQYYEQRYFVPACKYKKVLIDNKEVPFGPNLIFKCKNLPNFKFGIEICEDLWVATPPSGKLANCGANIIANLSASDEALGKSKRRLELVKGQSARLTCAYVYSNAGIGESSTDAIYSGHSIICENGLLLKESQKFKTGLFIADVDLERIESERIHANFKKKNPKNIVNFEIPIKDLKINRTFSKHPYIPLSKYHSLEELCEEALSFQVEALKTRLKSAKFKKVVLGVSGGLDSSLALCVIVRAFDSLKIDRKNIISLTMPCFGTSSKTHEIAVNLSKEFGVTLEEISIEKSVLQHFKDIGQDINNHDKAFENAQSRERTQVLMDIANKEKALFVGTADMSELALGFVTYNGDHMSMYGINCAVQKTLVKILLSYEAKKLGGNIEKILNNVMTIPITPELLPLKNNKIQQKTEDIIGPYELHDFFLYYFLQYGFSKNKILKMANIAFKDDFSKDEIEKYFKIFSDKFFKNQFKRSCMPDGPKMGDISLSPRGSFKMPSDATSAFL